MSKPAAIKFFNSVAGVLAMDLREVVLTCLGSLSGFLATFDSRVFSPTEAIQNIECDKPEMPNSFFTVQIELASEGTDKRKRAGQVEPSQKSVDLGIPRTLMNKISQQKAVKSVRFVLTPSRIRKDVAELVSKILSISQQVNRPEHHIISSILKNVWSTGKNDEEVQAQIFKIHQIVGKNLAQVERVKDLVKPFEFLWKRPDSAEHSSDPKAELRKEDVLSEVERAEKDFDLKETKGRIKALFERLGEVEQQVETEIPSEIGLSLLLVDCGPLKSQIRQILHNLRLRLESTVSQVIFAEIREIIRKFESSKSYLDVKFENASQLVQFESFLEVLRKKEFPALKVKFRRAVEWLRAMIPLLENLQSFSLELFRKGGRYIADSGTFLRSYGEVLTIQRASIHQKIERMKEHLRAKLEDGERELDEIRQVEHDYLSQKMLGDLDALQIRVQSFRRDSQIMEQEEAILGKSGSRLAQLDQFETDVKIFRDFWEMMEAWARVKEVERSPSLLHEDMEALAGRVEHIRSNGKRLLSEFRKHEAKNVRQVKMISGILGKLSTFWKEAEVLRFLCNPRLQVRHWNEINRVLAETEKEVGLDGKLSANFELSWTLLEDLELSKEFEKLERISQEADREFEIQEQLRDMRHFWERRMDLNSLFEKESFTAESRPLVQVHLHQETFEVIDTVSLPQVKARLEQDVVTLERVQLFKKFALFKHEIEDLRMVIEKTQIFVDILGNVEKYLRDLGRLCQSRIVSDRMPAKVKRAREIEERLRTILESGTELGIDRVMASKENEYLLRNFTKELAKVHKELWSFVNCLRERPGRVSWLSFEEILKAEDCIQNWAEIQKKEQQIEREASATEKAQGELIEQLKGRPESQKTEQETQDKLLDLGAAQVQFLEQMASKREAEEELGDILQKLFRGVKTLEMDKGLIVGVESFNGEKFKLVENVKVEISLAKVVKELDRVMKLSVQKQIYNGLGNYTTMDKNEFLEGRLNQIIFLVEMVVWTYEVENILLGEGSSGLVEYFSHFHDFISNFSRSFNKFSSSKS